MKSFLPLLLLCSFAVTARAQNVAILVPGRYASAAASAKNNWDKGDVILLDDSRYKLSNSSEVGDYRFSAAAQRVFFTSGPLKSAYTKVVVKNKQPVIIFPVEQNAGLGIKAEVWASRQ